MIVSFGGRLAGASAVLVIACMLACATDRPAPEPETAVMGVTCPTDPRPVARPPDVTDAHREVATWLHEPDADAILVRPDAAAELSARVAEIDGGWRDPLGEAIADPEEVSARIDERMRWFSGQLESGAMVEGRAGAWADAHAIVAGAVAVDEARVVVQEAALFCAPTTDGLYKPPIDRAFDRNRCTSLHPGEIVRVVRRSADERWLSVHAGHTTGWLFEPMLTPPQRIVALQRWMAGAAVVAVRDDARTEGGTIVRIGSRLPVVHEPQGDRRVVLVPTVDGMVEDVATVGDALHDAGIPLTRRALLTAAFSELDSPYGWGGYGGERDCSQLVRDLFATFDIQMPRHSGVQALVGTDNIDVAGLSDADKRDAIDRHAARGIVLLYMPGHIMIYLGRDGDHQYAISSISEYLTPCPGGPDTVHRLDRVAVTTLELGRDTERTAYIERITRLVVFAAPDVAD